MKKQLALIYAVICLASMRFLQTMRSVNSIQNSNTASSDQQKDDNSFRFALCHKTLFGDIDLQRVIQWSRYHFDLGFDDIYIWYMPEMRNRTGFVQLESLPYVHMIENSIGRVKRYRNGYVRMERDTPGNQIDSEKWCLQDKASKHDWVLVGISV